jgi:nucleoid-associated protein YgaU
MRLQLLKSSTFQLFNFHKEFLVHSAQSLIFTSIPSFTTKTPNKMGLFSFLKNAGAKLFKRKKEEVAEPVEAEKTHEENLAALRDAVADLGIEIKDFFVDLQGDTVIAFGEVNSQADKEKVILTLGNVEGVESVDDRMTVVEPEPEADFYEVKKGDSLSKIAKAYYGDAMKYPMIFEANKPMLKDPNLIYPGQMLRIPKL